MDQLSEQKLIQLLLEAHANELMLAHTLSAHIAMTPQGDYREGLELHLRETKDHAERIQRHLAKREHARGFIQVGYGMAQGMVGQVLAMTKFPMDLARGVSGEEKLLRNARDEASSEALEIAMYLAIEEIAVAAGDSETARLAKSIRQDEEAMLQRLFGIIPRLANDAFEAEVEGASHFDVRHIGAVDAARNVAGTAARTIARKATRAGRADTAKRSPATSRTKAGTTSTSSSKPGSSSRSRSGTASRSRGAASKAASTVKSSAKSTASKTKRAATKSTRSTTAKARSGSKATAR